MLRLFVANASHVQLTQLFGTIKLVGCWTPGAVLLQNTVQRRLRIWAL